MQKTTVYVELLNEGTPTWRPTNALILDEGIYELLPTPDYDPLDEEWAFVPGARVICEERVFEGYGGKMNKHLAVIKSA